MSGRISEISEKYKNEITDHNLTRDQLKIMTQEKITEKI